MLTVVAVLALTGYGLYYAGDEQLRPSIDGLAIRDGDRRALFLPKVWDDLPSPPDFLARLKQKAGLHDRPLTSSTQASRFTTETFS